jgi:SH3-like domain-containing protein
MKKNNKKLILIFFLALLFFTESNAEQNQQFLSLKNNEVNLRQGPSFEYPIILAYKKKYLPVLVVDKFETWVKISDFEKNSGWIHISQLSKKKTAINIIKNSILYKKPTIYSKPIVILETGRMVLIKKCRDKWCKISSGGFNGWVIKNSLWGKIK